MSARSVSDKDFWLQNNLNQLNIIGMYSPGMKNKIKLHCSAFLILSFCTASILDVVINCETLENYVEAFTAFLPAFATLIFLFFFILNRPTLYEVMRILRTEFETHEYSFKGEIISIRLVKYSQYYLYFVFVVYVILGIQSYLEREKENLNIHDAKQNGLPGRTWYPVDLTITGNFVIVLFLQMSVIIVIIHVTIPIAVLFASLLIHLRAQLFYLQDALITVCENKNPDEARLILKKCIRFHIMLIRFTETMQKTFSTILFIHNYSPSIVIAVVAYQASMMSILDPKFLPYISTVNYILVECFVYCYYGQHIVDQSSFLGFIAYSNKWYDCPPDITKDLTMIVKRCQKPLRMVFMGSTDASLETYYNIVKTGYSYFMFIASMGAPTET